MIIQAMFIGLILSHDTFTVSFQNDTIVNFCTFFTLLLLHWTCLPAVKNGLNMMKYAISVPEEFTHPSTAFLLGFIQLASVWTIQTCCLLKCLNLGKAADVITRFVAFGGLISIPGALGSSIEDFAISKAVGALTLKKSRKYASSMKENKQLLPLGWLFNILYCVAKWFYVTLYYYFFPFSCIIIPTFKLAYFEKKTA